MFFGVFFSVFFFFRGFYGLKNKNPPILLLNFLYVKEECTLHVFEGVSIWGMTSTMVKFICQNRKKKYLFITFSILWWGKYLFLFGFGEW